MFWYIENSPKINPTVIPTTGPSNMAPIITGTCIIVRLKIGRRINPKPLTPRNIEIPPNAPIRTSLLVLELELDFFFIRISPCAL